MRPNLNSNYNRAHPRQKRPMHWRLWKKKKALNLLTELAGDNSSEMSKLYCKKKKIFEFRT